MKFYGIIPAGGVGSRLGKLPVSKEIYPIIDGRDGFSHSVLCENLIRYFRIAGITDIHFIIRKGKWDIPNYLGDGSEFGVNLSYLIMNHPYGTPFTIDQAYPFVKDDYVALGFPDLINSPENLYSELKKKILETKADIVLGLCPIRKPDKVDMVEFEGNKIKRIVIKQERPDLKYGWTNAVWGPSFTRFSHEYLRAALERKEPKITLEGHADREIYVGDIVHAAIREGYRIEFVIFEEGSSIDLGTPDDLSAYMTRLNRQDDH